MVAFFGIVLFPSQLGSILPLLSKNVRSLSLCRATGNGRLGCYVHLLLLWFYDHLSVIAKAQLVVFLRRNRVKLTVTFDFPFTRDTDGWLQYLFGLSLIDWAWRVKWGVTRW